MIDLTPLDVRKKRGDFRKGLRGYETQEVDAFLELVAERLEELVKENLTLAERAERLAEQVNAQTGRERAVHEALVTAQELRAEIRGQAQKEADQIRRDAERDALHREREAELKARDIVAEAERHLKERQAALDEVERRRAKFLNAFRQLLQRELDVVAVEEGRPPLADMAVELDLGGGRDRYRERAPLDMQPAATPVEPADPGLDDGDAADADDAPVSLVALAPDDDTPPTPDADVHALSAEVGVEAVAGASDEDDDIVDIGTLAATPEGDGHSHEAGPEGARADDGAEGSGVAGAQLPGDTRERSGALGDIPTLEDLLGETDDGEVHGR